MDACLQGLLGSQLGRDERATISRRSAGLIARG